jgi:hypothetical protein
MRADKRRLAMIERSMAVPWTAFTRRDGAKVLVPDRMAITAFLNAIGGQPLGLGDTVEAFVADCVVDERAPDLEVLVVQIARKNAGVVAAALEQPDAAQHRPYSATRDPEEDPEAGDGGIDALLLEEERLVRADKSRVWIEDHYPEAPARGLDQELGGL